MKVEMYFLTASIISFVLAIILSILKHVERLPTLHLFNFAKKKEKPKKEKRLFPRHETSLKVKYKSNLIEGICWIGNINRSGTVLLLDRTLEVKAPLEMEINLPDGSRPIFLKGEIVWRKDSNAGVSFTEASLDDIKRVFSYIVSKHKLQSSNV